MWDESRMKKKKTWKKGMLYFGGNYIKDTKGF